MNRLLHGVVLHKLALLYAAAMGYTVVIPENDGKISGRRPELMVIDDPPAYGSSPIQDLQNDLRRLAIEFDSTDAVARGQRLHETVTLHIPPMAYVEIKAPSEKCWQRLNQSFPHKGRRPRR